MAALVKLEHPLVRPIEPAWMAAQRFQRGSRQVDWSRFAVFRFRNEGILAVQFQAINCEPPQRLAQPHAGEENSAAVFVLIIVNAVSTNGALCIWYNEASGLASIGACARDCPLCRLVVHNVTRLPTRVSIAAGLVTSRTCTNCSDYSQASDVRHFHYLVAQVVDYLCGDGTLDNFSAGCCNSGDITSSQRAAAVGIRR
jgi:hypothetical protein